MSESPLVLLFGYAHREYAAHVATALGASAVVLERRSLGVKLRLLRRRLGKQGGLTVAGRLFLRVWVKLFGRKPKQAGPRLRAAAFPAGCAVHVVSDINHADVQKLLADYQPLVVGVYGTSILRGSVLAALPADSFNLHTGLTQHYRGMASSFWALEAGHPEHIGVTVHRLSAGVDTGQPVAQRALGYDAYQPAATLEELDDTVSAAGEVLLLEVLRRAAAGENLPPLAGVNPGAGAYRTQPTLRQYRRVCRRFKLG